MSGRSFTAYAGLRPNQGSALGLSPGDRADLVTLEAPGGARFTVARKIAPQFNAFLQELTSGGYNLNPKASGGYNNRTIAGSPRLSQHAFGNAIDLNWDVNPRGSAKHNLPENVGDIASKYGLVWGGTFSNPDPMHFEAGRIVDGLPAYSAPPETHLAANAKREVAKMPNTAPQAMPVAGTTGTMAGLPDFGTLPSARKRKMAEAMMTNYRDQLARTTNPLGAISAMVQAGVGTHLGDQYDTEEKTYKRKLAEALMGAQGSDDLQRTMFASGDDDLVKAATSARIAAMKPQEPIEVGGNLVQKGPGGYQTVYSAPPKPVEPVLSEIYDDEGRLQKVLINPRTGEYKLAGGPKSATSGDPYKVVGKGGRIFDERSQKWIDQPADASDPELNLEQGKFEQGLRKEYSALSEENRMVQGSVARMRESAKMGSGAGDIAMIYSYMKMLDPTSVVREGEYATAANASGVPERVLSLYNKAITGQFLTPKMRTEFLSAGETLAKTKSQGFSKLRGQFEGIARKSGADPARIMLDDGGEPTAPPPSGQRPRATNPSTGETIEFNEQSGQWEPVR